MREYSTPESYYHSQSVVKLLNIDTLKVQTEEDNISYLNTTNGADIFIKPKENNLNRTNIKTNKICTVAFQEKIESS